MNIKRSLVISLAALLLVITPPPLTPLVSAESNSISIALNDICTRGYYTIKTIEDHGTHLVVDAGACEHGSYATHYYDAVTNATNMYSMQYRGESGLVRDKYSNVTTIQAKEVNNQTGIPISFTFSPPLYQGKYIIPGTKYTVSWTGDGRHIPIKFLGKLNYGDTTRTTMYDYVLGDSYSGSFTAQLESLAVLKYEPTSSASIISLPNAAESGVETPSSYQNLKLSVTSKLALCPYSTHPVISGDHPNITTSSYGDNASHSGGTNFTCHTCNRTWNYSESDAGSDNSSSNSSRKYVYTNHEGLQLSHQFYSSECRITYTWEPCPIHGYIGPHAVDEKYNVWGDLAYFTYTDFGLTQDVNVEIDTSFYHSKDISAISTVDGAYHYAPQFGYSGGAQAKAVVGKISVDTDNICAGYTNYVYAISGTSVTYTPVTSVKYKYKVIDMTYTEDVAGKAQRVISEGETSRAFTFSMPPAEIKIVIEASKLPQTIITTTNLTKQYNTKFNLGATVS